MSLRNRIVLAILALTGLAFWAQVDWILGDLRPRHLGTMEESMVDAATVLACLASRPGPGGALDLEPLRAVLADAKARRFAAGIYELAKTGFGLRVTVTDRSGRVVFDSDGSRDVGRDYSRWNDVIRTLRGEYGARTTLLDPADPRSAILHVAAPVMVNGEIAGVLTVAKSAESISEFLRSAKQRIELAGLAAVTAVWVFGALVTAWITRPIERLTRYAREVREGRRAAPPAFGGGEIGALAGSFEAMREALEGRQYVEEYVQTLTHETKAPLSSIRGAAELLEDEMPAPQRARFLATIRAESERILNLVDRLLRLASLERRRELRDVEDIAVADLVGEVAAGFGPLLESRRLSLARDLDPAARVRGERFLVRQALANLLQNAAEFSPPGGVIEVSARLEGANVDLAVRDHGPGIPDYALPKAFDRFFSLPRPDSGEKSTGLGLTLVREVAQLHGGTATLENASGGGARAILRLPAAPGSAPGR